ncbi:MAG TPA: hypothetical protein VGR00_10550 [Thermoanaerobaculia bacterium]|nr:hypothetical protein [Thermoanaerobaculia bacterium]
MSDDAFLDAFESATLPNEAFRHRDHVRAAWIILGKEPLLPALSRFRAALRRFAAAKGNPGLYHETITLAFLLLVFERRSTGPRDEGWAGFAARNSDLLAWKPSVLARYYDEAALASDAARASFLVPAQIARQT